ncbi:hypothetical protein CMI47_20275 [Candidatus Pacearchaeota archaeon]|nr:hypothetical protein [Candidatus Pacearchaeota archaeon]|tara:strand:- start:1135 stop:1479 length:345 start_codon:yes stop_codon:yes gene_type:complete
MPESVFIEFTAVTETYLSRLAGYKTQELGSTIKDIGTLLHPHLFNVAQIASVVPVPLGWASQNYQKFDTENAPITKLFVPNTYLLTTMNDGYFLNEPYEEVKMAIIRLVGQVSA